MSEAFSARHVSEVKSNKKAMELLCVYCHSQSRTLDNIEFKETVVHIQKGLELQDHCHCHYHYNHIYVHSS